ncbi:hypothetical protein P154DRAFT_298047 [Amniculicola lignicola CBS 123094]|uniref:Alcohol acetyltransferase n=1 Tax=Amniculicola lignicola CBS 123094 TaxID=1392246 RepID=A0A6A5W5B8_9PLEO|nr:hypothetical protein P154DRAFT_298047 [Amniculicola lignicola CBS 123094]
MGDLSSLEKLRTCGPIEKYSTARHHLGFYKNVGVIATYSNPSTTTPLEATIYAAVAKVISAHPILSAIALSEDTNDAHYARLPSVDLKTSVRFVERKSSIPGDGVADIELDAILEDEHNRDFKFETIPIPNWRLIVLSEPGSSKNFTAAFIFHHALGDGKSGLNFHRTLLSALQSLPSTLEDVETIVQSLDTPLLPPLEQLHPLPLGIFYIFQQLWNDFWPTTTPTRWTGRDLCIPSSSTPYIAKFRHIALSKATTSTLLTLSRKNKTTLQGTLETLLAATIILNLEEGKYDRLSVVGAISLRPLLLPPPGSSTTQEEIQNGMGVYVSKYSYEHHYPSSLPLATSSSSNATPTPQPKAIDLFSWDEARKVREAITLELEKKGRNTATGLLRWVSDIPKFFREKVGKVREDSFELSNIGVFSALPGKAEGENVVEGTWEVGRVVFSQSASVMGQPIQCCVASGGDGCAVVGFSWFEEVVNVGGGERLIERVVESFEESIEDLVKRET